MEVNICRLYAYCVLFSVPLDADYLVNTILYTKFYLFPVHLSLIFLIVYVVCVWGGWIYTHMCQHPQKLRASALSRAEVTSRCELLKLRSSSRAVSSVN